MKVGDLIWWGFTIEEPRIGLVIDCDDTVLPPIGDRSTAMLRVLFKGFVHPRWVHIQDCEVAYESR